MCSTHAYQADQGTDDMRGSRTRLCNARDAAEKGEVF